MTKILVLGSTGMLGNQVTKVLSKKFTVTEVNRAGVPVVKNNRTIKVDVKNIETLKNIFANEHRFDYVINCIGSIKQLITQSHKSVQNAILLNSLLPYALDELSIENNFRVIQICTDCVFSGKTGGNSEKSRQDPEDVYGKTKSLGEVSSRNTMNIRCSIVGHEMNSANSILDWFLGHPANAKIRGFTNHLWNGITTLHFSQVIQSLILNKTFKSGSFHLIPEDQISKYELLTMFANEYNRKDIFIKPIEMQVKVDRTLSTIYPEINNEMWLNAGYASIPTIQYMIRELRIQNDLDTHHE